MTQRCSILEFALVAFALMLSCAKPGVARNVKVAIIESEGFCTPLGNTSIESPSNWVGFIPDVVMELGKLAKFVPTFHLVADGRYGSFEESTGTWNGLIGEVSSEKVDFAAAPLTVISKREAHVDFTHEILDVGLVALIKRPELMSPVGRGATFFIGVFDSAVWGSAVAIFLVTSFLLHVNDRYNPREAQAKMAEHMTANTASASPLSQFTMLGSAFYVLSTGCFQGYQRAPRSLAGRCISLFWWVFACVFAATYTAALLCSLVASGSSPDSSFSYMDARDQYKIDPNAMKAVVPIWVTGGSTDAFMKNSSDPLFQFLYKQHVQELKDNKHLASISNVTELVRLVKSAHHYLAIMESPLADYYAKRSACELVVSGPLLTDKSYAFAFPEHTNATLLGEVNAAILQLRESGFIRHTYQKHFGGHFVPCSQGSNPSVASAALGIAGEELARMFRDSLPISLRTFAGPVVMYFLSLLLSAAAAMLDMQIYARLERRQHGVLRNTQEDEPNFSTLAFSDEQRQRQQQRDDQQQPLEDELEHPDIQNSSGNEK